MSNDDLNVTRFVNRLGLDLFIRTAVALAELFKGDAVRGLVFVSTAHLNVSHLNSPRVLNPLATDGLFPDSLRRPTSAYAVAKFLGLPRETVRRHLIALVEADYCTRTADNGYVILRSVLERPEVIRFARIVQGQTMALVADLAASGIGPHDQAVADQAGSADGSPKRSK
jgi:hypothetical protein